MLICPSFCRRLLVLIILLVSAETQCALAERLTGRVVGVTDGDTIMLLLPGNYQEKVRQYGIDCPEKKQPFGTKAKQFASDMVFDKVVELERIDKDRYGRTIGWVTVNGRSLNRELLSADLAWHYRQYSSDISLARLESAARSRRIGLWSERRPIAPWEWRRSRRK
jgi:micrococcal nuclease